MRPDCNPQTLTACLTNPCAKSKNHPKMNECHKLNAHPDLLKSMEEYRQEYGKGMTVSHTLEDS